MQKATFVFHIILINEDIKRFIKISFPNFKGHLY